MVKTGQIKDSPTERSRPSCISLPNRQIVLVQGTCLDLRVEFHLHLWKQTSDLRSKSPLQIAITIATRTTDTSPLFNSRHDYLHELSHEIVHRLAPQLHAHGRRFPSDQIES